MKIAFVGKGGSGKSTISSLFIKYLLSKSKTVVTVDADINMHVSGLLGIKKNPRLALSEKTNTTKIRNFLKGNNNLITKVDHFVKTTPPGNGSNLITINKKNFVIKNFAKKFDNYGYYMFVGTYNSDEIGTACYHTNLAIFENVLSHLVLEKNEWLVSDMVAGTDAFSNTLHAQFDTIVLVVEPTPEGISVYQQYKQLSKDAKVEKNLYVIGNKIEDKTDYEYLKTKIGNKVLGGFSLKKEIKQARQKDTPLKLSILNTRELNLLEKIYLLIQNRPQNNTKKLQHLYELHKKYVNQDYIVNEHGDISGQIDLLFKYPRN